MYLYISNHQWWFYWQLNACKFLIINDDVDSIFFHVYFWLSVMISAVGLYMYIIFILPAMMISAVGLYMSISYHQWWFLRSASVWAPLTWPGLCPPVAVIAVYHWPVAQTFADPDSVLSSPSSSSSPLSLNLLTAVLGVFFNNCKF